MSNKKILTDDSLQKLIATRHWLHAHPETAYKEILTADYICECLTKLNIPYEAGIAKTGIVAQIQGKGGSDRAIGIRADIDALPMQEENKFAHKSCHDNTMHGCGHDGHTAILLGLAQMLSENLDFDGKVYLIFQPAEEGHAGAKKMIEEGLFVRFPMERIFALHNWPSLPEGTIGTLNGTIMGSSYYLCITLSGRGGHGGMPHQATPLMTIAAHVQLAINSYMAQQLNSQRSAVVSLTRITSTDALAVLPEKVIMEGACRFLDAQVAEKFRQELPNLIKGIATTFGAMACVELKEVYPETVNDTDSTTIIRQAANKLGLTQENEQTGLNPSMASEDFSYMLQQCPGTYFWLGQRSANHTAALHAPDYDFNDQVLDVGIALFNEIVKTTLPLVD